jgi:hypothetical protein
MTETAGTALAAELRRYFSIGPRTRRYRDRRDLHAAMIEAIEIAAAYPGYYHQPLQDALHNASAVAYSYRKHVEGYRISGVKIAAIQAMSPWRFAAFIGQMVDAGVENVGQGERFLNSWQVAA